MADKNVEMDSVAYINPFSNHHIKRTYWRNIWNDHQDDRRQLYIPEKTYFDRIFTAQNNFYFPPTKQEAAFAFQ